MHDSSHCLSFAVLELSRSFENLLKPNPSHPDDVIKLPDQRLASSVSEGTVNCFELLSQSLSTIASYHALLIAFVILVENVIVTTFHMNINSMKLFAGGNWTLSLSGVFTIIMAIIGMTCLAFEWDNRSIKRFYFTREQAECLRTYLRMERGKMISSPLEDFKRFLNEQQKHLIVGACCHSAFVALLLSGVGYFSVDASSDGVNVKFIFFLRCILAASATFIAILPSQILMAFYAYKVSLLDHLTLLKDYGLARTWEVTPDETRWNSITRLPHTLYDEIHHGSRSVFIAGLLWSMLVVLLDMYMGSVYCNPSENVAAWTFLFLFTVSELNAGCPSHKMKSSVILVESGIVLLLAYVRMFSPHENTRANKLECFSLMEFKFGLYRFYQILGVYVTLYWRTWLGHYNMMSIERGESNIRLGICGVALLLLIAYIVYPCVWILLQ